MKFKFDFKKHILLNIPIFAIFYVVNKLCAAIQGADGSDIGEKAMTVFTDFGSVFSNPLPSFNIIDLLIAAVAAALFWFIQNEKRKNAKKYRPGSEYGSARWGTAADMT